MQSRNEIDIWTLKCMSTVQTAQWGYANYQDNDDKPLRYRICRVYHTYTVRMSSVRLSVFLTLKNRAFGRSFLEVIVTFLTKIKNRKEILLP